MRRLRLGALAAFIGIGVGVVHAQIVPVAGTATGRFNANPFTVSPNDTDTLLGLTFRGSTFSDVTAGGFVAFGAQPMNPNFNNFGSMTLTAQPATYSGNTFTLRLVFSAPAFAQHDFVANLLGTVNDLGGGGVFIDFGPPQTFNFGGGTATVTVNDLSVNPGFSNPISGNVVVAPVPEPASIAALGIGGLGLLRARRRKKVAKS